MSNITRRAALAAVPAFGLVPIASAEAEPISTVLSLFREWEVLYRRAGDMSWEEEIASGLLDQCRDVEKRMMALPSRSAADFAAKLIVGTAYGDFLLPGIGEGGLLDDALALLA